MAQLIDQLSGGHTTFVKIVLASVLLVLALYQGTLAAVFYGKLRVTWLHPDVAPLTHRATGDALVVVAGLVALTCLSGYEVPDAVERGGLRVLAHSVLGALVLVVLSVKVLAVNRGGPRLSRALPYLGAAVVLLFAGIWGTSALPFLGR
jgi:hypothetical protein